ncbi:excisionase [Xanthobacter versatilis]|uniref:excisionase n=1 Tax=Xanthobacter autotrophicus (strain ATCC BAA-1158 / Py2) TaxID=78245 RepID=UPI00372A295F
MTKRIPRLDEVTDTMPLRLSVAAALAFPDGSMGSSGLRREAAKGRLAVERIAGKDYTTLRAIEEMREKCRVQPKAPVSGSNPKNGIRPGGSASDPSGSSATGHLRSALDALLLTAQQLNSNSPTVKRRS